MHKALPSHNEAWGFWGTIRHHADPEHVWPIAMQAITDATGCSDIAVRDFLDSRHGRHFADDVASGLFKGLTLQDAIDAAVDRWMNWTIGRRIERELGIPRGLSFSLPGVEPLALIRRLRDHVSFSASSACATDKVQTSHVLLAMFGDTPRARQAFRISPGRFTPDAEAERVSTLLIEAARELRRMAA